ncbi:DUF1003 domain-containing protein [Micropruina sp.]|uniref:DUF1003 domain-containing protein n=1 Tax=Micropruina sp. TaxID=2737536 RepID=UPI0039E2DE12
MSSSDRLNTPGRERRWLPRVRMDSEVFGSFAEGFARFMGTASFLIWMTVLIVAWVCWNVFAPAAWIVDEFPFIFLTLLLSLQASYAAPLILLAQNRQEARERVSLEHDREVAAQARADTDFLAREIAALRMRIGDLATRDFIRSELRDLLDELDKAADAEDGARGSGRDHPRTRDAGRPSGRDG